MTGVSLFLNSLGAKAAGASARAGSRCRRDWHARKSRILRDAEIITTDVQAAARALGLRAYCLEREHRAGDRHGFRNLDSTASRRAPGQLPIRFFISRRDQIVALAARHAVPAIYQLREFVAAGGLMSYGTSIADAYRQVGVYTGRILKGDKAGRPAGHAADQVRAGHQPQDRQGARPRPCRRRCSRSPTR